MILSLWILQTANLIGRHRSMRTDNDVELVKELALSQENDPRTHRTVRKSICTKRNTLHISTNGLFSLA